MPAGIRRTLPIVTGLVLLAAPAAAQISSSGRITGRVMHGETGGPIDRAEVRIVGTLLRATTDLETARRDWENTVWPLCVVRRVQAPGDTVDERLFGPIVERHGRFKFVTFANKL